MTADTFLDRIGYRTKYFDHPGDVLEKIRAKTIVPYQVELQPGRLTGRNICWMKCSYCYGGSSENVADRLTPERYLQLIEEMASGPHGDIDKAIIAGYATDPLNYEYIDELVDAVANKKMVIGIHTKLLRVSDRLIERLTAKENRSTNYITISVDAGDAKSYNRTHGIESSADVYSNIIENISSLINARERSGAVLDVATNYLLTRVNSDFETVERGVANLVAAGVDSIRFSFPQIPRGQGDEEGTIVPTRGEVLEIQEKVAEIAQKYSSKKTKIVVIDVDSEKQLIDRRTFPCFARFIYPAVSFDGYLSHCSQSAAPHFRNMALGNLKDRSFWEAFYDYDPNDLWQMLERQHEKMKENDCRCDRKEHTVNQIFRMFRSDAAESRRSPA